jgi:hypothetical protein
MSGREIRMNLLMLGAIADILTTYIGLQQPGTREANPIMRLAMKHLGFTGMAICKLGLHVWLMRHGDASPLATSIVWLGPVNNTILLTTGELEDER